MTTFNNDGVLKAELIKKLKHHEELDTFIKGSWLTDEKVEGNGFKGCFYGCTMQTNTNPREKFSEKYHIDLWYCYLTEKLFENLPDGEYQKFPVKSIEILPVGFDFNKAKSSFHRGMLLKHLDWVTDENVRKVVNDCADLFLVPYNEISESAARSAESARSAAESAVWSARSAESARSAARSARSAAESAVWSARSAESARSAAESARSARSAVWSAAESAVWSARSAAVWSARSAAESAVWSARSAESARSAVWSARSVVTNHYVWMRDLLFECIKNN